MQTNLALHLHDIAKHNRAFSYTRVVGVRYVQPPAIGNHTLQGEDEKEKRRGRQGRFGNRQIAWPICAHDDLLSLLRHRVGRHDHAPFRGAAPPAS